MTPVVGFSAQNHPQQVLVHGARVDVDERATPPEFFAQLDRRFRFTVDACALPYNAKLERYFAPPGYVHQRDCMWDVECPTNCKRPHDRKPLGVDGLGQSWTGERVWCNPPFSDIEPWVRKAWVDRAELVVMLLPANRAELSWWQEMVEPFRDRAYACGYCGAKEWPLSKHGSPEDGRSLRVEFLPGRLRFGLGGAAPLPNTRPPFGCCLLIWEAA